VPVGDGEVLDYLCGHWRIFQLEKGHKYSVDDVLTAHLACTAAPRVERHLDLGSGIGSVALLCAWRLPGTRVTTIEAQDVSFSLSQRSVSHNGVRDRFVQLHGDLRDAAVIERALASHGGGPFDLVTGTPPYWPVGNALPSAHAQAVPARLETRGDIADYARAAMLTLAPGGVFVCVHQGSQRARVQAALRAGGLAVARVLPVCFKEGAPIEESGLHLYACPRAEDVPSTVHEPVDDPPLVIRTAAGATHPRYAALRLSFGFPPGNVPGP
jgi:tRNA1(Val) A37 N6-methylase TrmN6